VEKNEVELSATQRTELEGIVTKGEPAYGSSGEHAPGYYATRARRTKASLTKKNRPAIAVITGR
jgi:hypothetical protein